ncbi:hypothetical protein [Legionella israelensis]|uniref:Dot/Icm T4SS effector n=1 Tax=Legionella israelensis TaxID=454 RepID=A0A0W0WM67_9GAMM|nr:hypothetical protein [Legionella israelensis]KTD33424.1 Dot/Icm T4SS effector [Legionella israelensis]QBS09169.1 hypothetical protein E4T55_04445 [Legionella israelensis]SCY29625.1 hypothetical protein SAMN02746069_01937 [Legionella israelensis DSM 19235]STX58900.1 Uncharacterised protein [Legionella israelensis]
MAESKLEAVPVPEKKDVKGEIENTRHNLTVNPRLGGGIRGDEIWSENVMKVVLARKEARRKEKAIESEEIPLPLNYMVCKFKLPENVRNYSLEGHQELAEFIDFLKNNIQKLPVGLRFQMAVLVGGHWTVVDNMVTTKGISSFNLDSVMDSKAYQFFMIYLTNLQEAHLLNASYAYRVSVPQGPFEKTPKEKLANMIQSDWVSCGIFMVDHLSFLSRTDVFHHLKSSMGESQYQAFGRADVPPSLAGIFRLAQMEELISKISKKQSIPAVTRKGKTLADVKKQINPEENTEYITANARNKGAKILDEAEKYVDSCEEEIFTAIFSRSLKDKLSVYVEHYSQAVNDLVAFIYDRLPECKDLPDEDKIKLMEALHQIILTEDSDQDKIISINDQLMSVMQHSNEAASYRLVAAVISYTALHIKDNQELWQFYQKIATHPLSELLQSHNNWFFKMPSKLTPALFSYIEKVVKTQMLLNGLEGLKEDHTEQLDFLEDGVIQSFLKKPRVFEASETKSIQLLNQLKEMGNEKSELKSIELQKIEKDLEKRREDVLKEFHMETLEIVPEDTPSLK